MQLPGQWMLVTSRPAFRWFLGRSHPLTQNFIGAQGADNASFTRKRPEIIWYRSESGFTKLLETFANSELPTANANWPMV